MKLNAFVLVILLLCARSISVHAKTDVNNIEELVNTIEQIKVQTKTPGVGVAIITPQHPNWVYYSGLADISNNIPITQDTQFRFASISKMFVSLAILKLAQTKALSLDTKVSEIAPEVLFSNPYDATAPLRIVHLLNHSSGWDSPHFAEQRQSKGKQFANAPQQQFADSVNAPISALAALQMHPHSRFSRWPPGSRVAYNNTGYLAAAYIVEKVTGMTFEEYVRQEFFTPLKMSRSGYYFSDLYRTWAATLYENNRVIPYQHLNNRAGGALNSTVGDMLRFLQVLTAQVPNNVVDEFMLNTLATPVGTSASDAGVEFTWGLGTQVFHSNGVVLHGHEGSLRGTHSILAYNATHKIGYLVVANSSGPAVSQIHRVLSEFVTKGVASKVVVAERVVNDKDLQLDGWYKNAAPISDVFSLVQTMVPFHLSVTKQRVSIKPLLGGVSRELIPNHHRSFKHATTGLTVLVPTNDKNLSNSIYYGPNTLVKTNAILALLPVTTLVFWFLMSLSGLLMMLVWLPRFIFVKSVNTQSAKLRAWPLYNVGIAIVVGLVVHTMSNSDRFYALSGDVTLASVTVFIATLCFAICSLYAIWVGYNLRNIPQSLLTKWHTRLFIVANTMMTILLASNQLVGLRLWL